MDDCNHAKVGVTLLALQGKRPIVHTTSLLFFCFSVFLFFCLFVFCFSVFLSSAILSHQHSDSDLTASSNCFSAILVLANGRLRMVISPLVDPLMFAPSEAKSPVHLDWAFCLPWFIERNHGFLTKPWFLSSLLLQQN